eukprot:UN22064
MKFSHLLSEQVTFSFFFKEITFSDADSKEITFYFVFQTNHIFRCRFKINHILKFLSKQITFSYFCTNKS